jgi:hypothetical protein
VLYQQDIEPAYMKLRETKYVYSQVETTENANGALVEMYNDQEFNLSQKKYSYHELYMPVIMPKWIADNRIISQPVGSVSAPGSAVAAAAAVEQTGNKWYPGKAAEIKAMQARAAEAKRQ